MNVFFKLGIFLINKYLKKKNFLIEKFPPYFRNNKYFYIILRNKKKGAPRKFIFYFQYKILKKEILLTFLEKKIFKSLNNNKILFFEYF